MTAPLIPPHIDLRDFPYMPLDVVRLRDSDLAAIASGDGFRAAVMLWCAAWHQLPAASLPKDDRLLASLAGFGRDVEAWKVVKEDALRNFVECDDGRLYHPTIAEKAREAWEAKVSRRQRTEAARLAKLSRSAASGCGDTHTAPVAEIVTESVTSSKGREGKGDSLLETSSNKLSASALRELAERFYKSYPKHVDPRDAEKRFAALVKKGEDPEKIIAAAARYAEAHRRAGTEKQFIPAPAVWLNKGGYLSDDLPNAVSPQARAGPAPPQQTTDPIYLAAAKLMGEANGERELQTAGVGNSDTGDGQFLEFGPSDYRRIG